ncbi:MAG: lipopolysaccharide heptosyltransferase II [Candidatus Omnitrophica bacterium]|nr:lipopolysaccharide heptosyltransferase II [Candidatus Omnitrophota bacterium]MDD5654434.1 lipopolysaccharide heptosyltransferase II [Candidatus Omnitrophota bacterium]
MKMKANKILIFNVNWLGDVLFSTAVIRNIRYNFPDSYIACVVPERCRPVLEGNPNLNEIIIFDERGRHRGFAPKLRFLSLLRAGDFDTVFLLHRSFTRALLCYLAKIPQRIGYYTHKRAWLLTRKIPQADAGSMHRIDYYLNVIEKAGLEVKDRFTEFCVNIEHERYVEEFLSKEGVAKNDLLVVVNPGGNWNLKRWPAENFSGLCDRIISELKAKVMIIGDTKDAPLAESIMKKMRYSALNAAGKFQLKQTGALLKRADIFISCDSGPLHIANAVGAKRIIALFGPTSAGITGPYPRNPGITILQKDTGCKIPCYKLDCEDNRCMKALTVEDVMEKIRNP